MSKEDKMIQMKKEESAKKKEAVKKAVAKLKRAGNTITIAAICREAKVSKNFIHSHKDLYDLINENRQEEDKKPKSMSSKKKQSIMDMLRSKNSILLAENCELRKELEKASTTEDDSLQQKYEILQQQYSALLLKYNELLEQENLRKFPSLMAEIAKRNKC